MTLAETSKAVGSAIAGASGAPGLLYAASLTIPSGVDAPWWAYVAAGLAQAAWNFYVTFYAPKNAEATS